MGTLIAITGANAAVGRALLRIGASEATGSDGFVACVRSERAERELPSLPAGSRVERVAYDDVSSLERAFEHAAAVVHLPGLLIERSDSSYAQANLGTAAATIEAARRSGVTKVVLVSAVGANARSPNGYFRSKGEAEEALRGSGLRFTILRAPLVLGRGTEGSAALRRRLTGKTTFVPGGGRHTEQPLAVDDLARAALRATAPDTAPEATLDLVGPETLTERDLIRRAATLAGRTVRVRSVPLAPLRLALALRTRLLGPGFSPDALEVVQHSTQIDPAPAARALGLDLVPLDAMLREALDEETS